MPDAICEMQFKAINPQSDRFRADNYVPFGSQILNNWQLEKLACLTRCRDWPAHCLSKSCNVINKIGIRGLPKFRIEVVPQANRNMSTHFDRNGGRGGQISDLVTY